MHCVVQNSTDKTNESDLRVRIPAELKIAWDLWCERKRITQQAAIESLVSWIMSQDDVLVAVVLRQLELDEDIRTILIDRIGADARTRLAAKKTRGG